MVGDVGVIGAIYPADDILAAGGGAWNWDQP
jgi:hypothetical protein